MKAFTTITELEILYKAYNSILADWVRAEENYSKSILTGFPNEISKHRRDKYHEQLNELHQAILELEQGEEQ